MIVFKCKMCGGEMELEEGATVAECPYCMTKQTLPKLDNDKRANMYDRANHFRRQNEYDKAMAIFENILQEDRTDAEAYWSLVLCRYGIEYVEDPATHKRVPTVNRVQYTSILADEDYKSALEYADFAQRSVYEEEAKAIDEIQKGILAISKQEKPFDIFICYKETDANGRRTPDSVLANDLYHQLTNEGFKVFFSRITLEDKIGTAYEPYIFAALNSAKVMVVLGTKPEYFNAVWVKNEWSRYLALIRAGADKTLVPAYRDMDPYDLPDEFSHLQAQDMSKLGFMQDLIRGIKKLVAQEDEKSKPQSTSQQSAGGVTIESLMKRATLFLEDGDYSSANEYLDKVLDIDPEYAPAYVGKTQVAVGVPYEASLAVCLAEYEISNDWKKAIRFATPEQRTIYEGYVTKAQARREEKRKEDIYQKANNILFNANLSDECNEARRLFSSIPGYRDSDKKQQECAEKAKEIEERRAAVAEKARRERVEQERKAEEQRQEALRKAEQARLEQERIQKQKQKEEEEKKKRETKIKTISVLAIVIVTVLIILYTTVISPQIQFNNTFNQAKDEIASGKYWEALRTLETISDHEEVPKFITSSQELQGEMARIAKYDKGNIITLGSYEQDGIESNGKEPIEWVILGEENEKRIMVSKLVLDYQFYNTEQIHGKGFEGSYLQSWLKNDFLTNAFSPEEQSKISQVTLLENSASIYSKTKTYNVVTVRTILDTQAAKPSAYAASLGSDGSYALKNVLFSLSKSSDNYAYEITESGYETEYGARLAQASVADGKYYYEKVGVRPVIWIDISHLQ